MRIAAPVKFNKANPPISPLFGHAKWFAFVENGKMTREANPYDGGMAVVDWLLHRGVDVILAQHIGLKPYLYLEQEGVAIYYPGEGRVFLEDAMRAFKEERLQRITHENIEKFTRHQGHR